MTNPPGPPGNEPPERGRPPRPAGPPNRGFPPRRRPLPPSESPTRHIPQPGRAPQPSARDVPRPQQSGRPPGRPPQQPAPPPQQGLPPNPRPQQPGPPPQAHENLTTRISIPTPLRHRPRSPRPTERTPLLRQPDVAAVDPADRGAGGDRGPDRRRALRPSHRQHQGGQRGAVRDPGQRQRVVLTGPAGAVAVPHQGLHATSPCRPPATRCARPKA